MLTNADKKFNKLTLQKEKAPVPIEVLLSQNVNIDKHPQKANMFVEEMEKARES